ncbi:ribbon-helix-helix domain-containing protein [Patescibacteria group bacterium]|nr:ribbon-helix-helix domain-containing protein [Patescibacteria group bacterium]MBU1015817.1 ribbon-helix-helix domain-containing protein [Patescibacteria group bacterium]MBU1685236.1 ribbon-helix-helix domain-containing protein [Patescibacteria group bacterium]MBU1938245.1 ribbon-helix-helix domain-containing protein [Patescibacteria group bacterium]
MSTLSIPVDADTLNKIEMFIKEGAASNKADFVRKAIDRYLEEKAIEDILRAAKEPGLEGDLNELAKKF